MGVSSVEAVVYGIKWAHSMAGLISCPVSHPLVKSALEGAKRKLAGPVSSESIKMPILHASLTQRVSDGLNFKIAPLYQFQ